MIEQWPEISRSLADPPRKCVVQIASYFISEIVSIKLAHMGYCS